jgi:predicted dienelactone hydrolase
MRALETLLTLLNTVYLIFQGMPRREANQQVQYLPLLGVLAAVLQFAVEELRWQMVPMYTLTFALLAHTLIFYINKTAEKNAKCSKKWGIVGWVLLIFAFLLPILVPIPDLPEPSGLFPVGTTSFFWVDESREEHYADTDSSPKRQIMVQAWYPAAPGSEALTAPYLEGLPLIAESLGRRYNLPPFLFSYIEMMKTNAYLDAPLAGAEPGYPVLIFSHGWFGYRSQSTYLMEELASHGYIIFSADHTHGALATVFPDGEVVLSNSEALPSGVPEAQYKLAIQKLGDTWVGDLRFILDQVEHLNSGKLASPFAGQLDLTRLGIFGHSTGGGAAVEACWLDERCQTGLALDAWLEPYSSEMTQVGLVKPFLFLESENWSGDIEDENTTLFIQLYERTTSDIYWLTIAGSKHFDFADIPPLTPLVSLTSLNPPLFGKRILEITSSYSLAFFERFLGGEDQPLLESPSPDFPEVRYKNQ